ncbi:MAG: hypothetical protein H0T46_33865 [Deltaproteobacteria bacterium]|nr:hypothetical protein [Deltaproteobacteria bacterium]
MRSRRRAHASLAVLIATASTVIAQPAPVEVPEVPPAGSGGSGAPPVPAGSSPVESNDIPDLQPPPARFAVVPFENHANVRAFDWLIAGAPFEIAEKTEGVLGLEAAGGTLYVGSEPVAADPKPIAAFAARHNVQWVITGWVTRPNWELEIAITLWRVKGGAATITHEAKRRGPVPSYHKLLGEALEQVWTTAGTKIDPARAEKLQRPLAIDIYAVTLLGRGLGHFSGALAPAVPADPVAAATARAKQLDLAEHDLERAVFIDPKCFEAQRAVGELYRLRGQQQNDPKLLSRAAGKFAYANDLAPDDLQSLRAAAQAAADAGKHESAYTLFRKVVTRRPWDLEARYQLGAAMWKIGDGAAAEHQLLQVTQRHPDHLAARRVLVLVHASRSDTQKLVTELEAIAQRAPTDLEVKAELATGYAALGRWDKSTTTLEAIAAARAPDLALLVRIGDGHRRLKDLDGALAWYGRASKAAPDSSLPGFSGAQLLLDNGKLPEAIRAYTNLQKFREHLPAAEQALGVIALMQGRANDAAWYLRRAVRAAPRSLPAWRALITAELARKDAVLAQSELERARGTWPTDGILHYLAAVAYAQSDARTEARTELLAALKQMPSFSTARSALDALDASGTFALAYVPEVVRPWGDAQALQEALDRYAVTAATMATVRTAYQAHVLSLLGVLGKGPLAPAKAPAVRTCPIGRAAPLWASAQGALRRYERLGVDLEASYRYIARHDEVGANGGLLPNARTQLIGAKKTFRTALADIAELRAEFTRGLGPELRRIGCNDRLLAAAVSDPERYRVIIEDRPDKIPEQTAPRARPRATFYIDNTRCVDPVDVWIDGAQIGQVAPGRRSALVSDGGKRTLCLLGPGSAQCGDRGTVRQVYLHDGWSVTQYCPK